MDRDGLAEAVEAAVKGLVGDQRLAAERLARDEYGCTALHMAAGRVASPSVMVATMVADGADPGARMKDGRTPLHMAALGKDPAIVRVLVDAGAEVDARTEGGLWTPLHLAAGWGGSGPVVQALLEAGADLEAEDVWKYTPLLHASIGESALVVKVLVKAGAEVELRGGRGQTPLHFAAGAGKEGAAMVGVLIEAGLDVNARRQHGLRPLHMAAQGGTAETVKVLVKAGAEVNQLSDLGGWANLGGWTPLHWAALLGRDPAAVKALVDAGGAVNAWTERGDAALHIAMRHKDPGVAAVLLDAGADPVAEDSGGRIPRELIPDDSALRGSNVYQRLVDAEKQGRLFPKGGRG